MQVQAVDIGVSVNMPNGSYSLFCRLDGLTPAVREQQRVATLKKVGLLEAETIPVFDEATQTAARFIEAPICILGIMVHEQLWLKSAVGLSRLGLMNELASSRKIPRQEAFDTYVVDSQQSLMINDTLEDDIFVRSLLVHHYGIRAYLGTPLMTTEGQCIGVLAVMDLVPRQFTSRDREFLALNARWCLREFEINFRVARDHLLKTQATRENEWLLLNQSPEGCQSNLPTHPENSSVAQTNTSHSMDGVKLKLLRQLTQELRTPLTAVIGMSSVLRGQVFGVLTSKQKEYIDIIHNSGQHLNSLVEEILKLGVSDDNTAKLQLTPVNVEMLCQQSLTSLGEIAKQKRQELRLSIEPGKRIWLLDKEKVRQALYYLVISIIESAEAGGEVRIHISRRRKTLNIAVWLSHPWLGDGLPQVTLYSSPITNGLALEENSLHSVTHSENSEFGTHADRVLSVSSLEAILHGNQTPEQPSNSQELLGLLLSCHLVESHGGKIIVQGTAESGCRYVLMLPKIAADENSDL